MQGRREASPSSQYLSFMSMGLSSTVLPKADPPNTPPRAKGRGVSETVFLAEAEFDYITHTSSKAQFLPLPSYSPHLQADGA